MRKKVAILLMILTMMVNIIPIADVYAAEGINVQFFNGNRDTVTNTINLSFNLVNTETTPLTLSNIKMRYYFTNDGTQTDNFACDYSPIGSSNVTGIFGAVSATNADTYLEVGFNHNAGTLAAGASVVIYARVWKSDWTAFTQTNDYSYNSTATGYVDTTSVTGYLNGILASGIEPGTTITPIPSVTPSVTVTPTPSVTPSITVTPTPSVTPGITPTPTPGDIQSTFKSFFIGHYDTSDTVGPKFAWSMTTIKANFQGTGISVNLKSTGDNWFNVIIDNVVMSPINVSPSTLSPITLTSGLANGIHTIELVRRTEAYVGEVQFLGFTVTDGSLLDPPAPSSKRILFIGDSITCGYGNEGTSQYQSFTTKNENAYLAYGAVTSRLLEADSITVCWSGKGVMRNYGGETTDLMPEIYQQILPYNASLLWDASQWIPQVVVINLCTNDYSIGIPDKTAFTSAYSNLINDIRNKYPSADIYCAVGPMLYGDDLASARDYISGTVDLKKLSGDEKIHYIEFAVQDAANGYGEDWHPNVKTHELMANQLTAQIMTDLGW